MWCSPPPVIPAHAGIQVRSVELAWIPAFAGTTDPGGLFVLIPTQIFLLVTFVLFVVINLTSDISVGTFN
ncbi:MAG: hypothetical protein QOF64_1940 [Candidatus Binatota bacterium]|nr:hypothetical protein [Candidatus Binatota bacterium]